MKKLAAVLAIALLSVSMNVNAQEKEKEKKTAKTEKSCSADQKKGCKKKAVSCAKKA